MDQNNKNNSITQGIIIFFKIAVILLIILIFLFFGIICGMSTYEATHPRNENCPLPKTLDNDTIDEIT